MEKKPSQKNSLLFVYLGIGPRSQPNLSSTLTIAFRITFVILHLCCISVATTNLNHYQTQQKQQHYGIRFDRKLNSSEMKTNNPSLSTFIIKSMNSSSRLSSPLSSSMFARGGKSDMLPWKITAASPISSGESSFPTLGCQNQSEKFAKKKNLSVQGHALRPSALIVSSWGLDTTDMTSFAIDSFSSISKQDLWRTKMVPSSIDELQQQQNTNEKKPYNSTWKKSKEQQNFSSLLLTKGIKIHNNKYKDNNLGNSNPIGGSMSTRSATVLIRSSSRNNFPIEERNNLSHYSKKDDGTFLSLSSDVTMGIGPAGFQGPFLPQWTLKSNKKIGRLKARYYGTKSSQLLQANATTSNGGDDRPNSGANSHKKLHSSSSSAEDKKTSLSAKAMNGSTKGDDDEDGSSSSIEGSEVNGSPKKESKIKALFKEYGPVAIGTYLSVYVFTLTSIFLLYDNGFSPLDFGGDSGSMMAKVVNVLSATEQTSKLIPVIQSNPHAANFALAWITAKFTEPVRLVVTLAIVPKIARMTKARKQKKQDKK